MDTRAHTVKEEVERIIEAESSKPFIVSVMGQTGVGKSSLINALFNTDLLTDRVRPCTKDAEKVVLTGRNGHEMWFWDLPGIGEAGEADESYIEAYRQKLLESDVAIWAMHSDTRSVAYDLAALREILGANKEEQVHLMSKLTFVLTKADLLARPPWIFARARDYGVFAPSTATRMLLAEKEAYYRDSFIRPFGDLMTSHTYNDSGLDVAEAQLMSDRYTVSYRGLLDRKSVNQLKQRFPQHDAIFERLHDNYRVIPCSSLFRFNLYKLMVVIVNKLGKTAISRFNNFVTGELNAVSVSDARTYCNLVVVDRATNQLTFDLAQQRI